MARITLDFEVEATLDLKKAGTCEYSVHPNTWPLCLAYRIDDGFSTIWLPGQEFPQELAFLIANGPNEWVAFNASFEVYLWAECVKKLGWPPIPVDQWVCSRAQAAYYGLPRGLDKICRVLDMGLDGKDKVGHKAMMRICKPNKKGIWKRKQADIEANWNYCIQDVDCEAHISHALPPLPPIEQRIWQVDQQINARGIPVDLDICRGGAAIFEQCKAIACEAVTAATLQEDGTSIADKPTQYQRLIPWIWKEHGVHVPNWQEDTIKELLEEGGLPEPVHTILKARADTSSSAPTKFAAAIAQSDENGVCKNQHDYYGAITGRWGAKGVQFHNLKNVDHEFEVTRDTINAVKSGKVEEVAKYGDPVSVLGNHVRSMVLAPEEMYFAYADYSSIEARIVAWFARDIDTLVDFEQGVCLYSKLGAKIYNVLLEDVHKKGVERKVGKAAILGLGFKMGAATFQAQVYKQAGIRLPLDMCEEVVRVYREEFVKVTELWTQLEQSAFMAIRNPGKKISGWGWAYEMTGDYLTLELPSGRHLYYYQAHIVEKGRWGKPEIQYTGPKGRAFLSVSVLVENLVQATARDIQANAILECAKEKLPVVTHVHDSIYCLVPVRWAPRVAVFLEEVMCRVPAWSAGIPIKSESGYSERVQ